MPPRYVRHEWPDLAGRADLRFFRDRLQQPIGDADPQLLASLERPDLPTVHNMIMGDRIVSKIDPADAMRYATFLARRLIDLYRELRADVIIGSFDALHGGIALAVARHLNIPWFALNFSVIPAGLVCFCDRMSPAARVQLGARPIDELRAHAETALKEFESRKLQAPAYIAPSRPSLSRRLSGLPARPLELRMSRSSPGRYALHEFAKNVYAVKAVDSRGRALRVSRPNPHQWNVAGHDGTVTVTYTLFGDRADGTYAGIDLTHAHLNMPATFMWARGLEARPVRVTAA
jgi:hypothetical protein